MTLIFIICSSKILLFRNLDPKQNDEDSSHTGFKISSSSTTQRTHTCLWSTRPRPSLVREDGVSSGWKPGIQEARNDGRCDVQKSKKGREEGTHADEEAEAWLVPKHPAFPTCLWQTIQRQERHRPHMGALLTYRTCPNQAGRASGDGAQSRTTCKHLSGSDSSFLGDDAPYSTQHPAPQPGKASDPGARVAAACTQKCGCHRFHSLRTGSSLPLVVGEGKHTKCRKALLNSELYRFVPQTFQRSAKSSFTLD